MSYFSGLHTDRYELTMLDAALRSGMANRRSVFEVFTRSLAGGRRYGVVAGLGRLIEIISSFAFDDSDLKELEQEGVVSSSCLSYLANYRFRGDIDAYAEGELYFPFSPVLTVEASFAEALVLETVVLSVLNHDSAVAAAASRMVQAAKGRSIIEMGSRRTHEEAAVSAARAAYLVGFASTSNLEAARRYGIPSAGTVAHAFILAYPDEASAFQAQIAVQGTGTTLLVDTFDIPQGIRSAVSVAGTDLGAIRIDSGDLFEESWKARSLLDDLGATKTKIVVSGDLDEYRIAALADAPIDAYGVGTKVVTGSGVPTPNFVYKLVAIADADRGEASMKPVAKASLAKSNLGGRKVAYRLFDEQGLAVAEHIDVATSSIPDSARPLQVPVMREGEPVGRFTLEEARAHHRLAMAELPAAALELSPGDPALVLSGPWAPDASANSR